MEARLPGALVRLGKMSQREAPEAARVGEDRQKPAMHKISRRRSQFKMRVRGARRRAKRNTAPNLLIGTDSAGNIIPGLDASTQSAGPDHLPSRSVRAGGNLLRGSNSNRAPPVVRHSLGTPVAPPPSAPPPPPTVTTTATPTDEGPHSAHRIADQQRAKVPPHDEEKVNKESVEQARLKEQQAGVSKSKSSLGPLDKLASVLVALELPSTFNYTCGRSPFTSGAPTPVCKSFPPVLV